MGVFEEALEGLNARQRTAVTTIDGPVLVIAGPGTGKTQLISTRIGYILQNTDTLPQNILCLTFTEAGASTMRDRLIQMLGQSAYDVRISTYHAFGSELLRGYPEYFEQNDVEPVDEVGRIEILSGIIERLPYSNPLKFADGYLRDIVSFISDTKRALLEPNDIIKSAQDNLKFIELATSDCQESLNSLVTINKKCVPLFESMLQILQHQKSIASKQGVLPLNGYCTDGLRAALDDFSSSGKTSELTKWKNKWLAKDNEGKFIFDGKRANLRLIAAGEIYQKYQDELKKRRLFDFDDMILRTIAALEQNPDFKFSLAEQFQYLMLDEFQDTNAAQMHLIELLTDHPVHEGRPNVLAVGDDDQAIYAFQGADHANMAHFAKTYQDVDVISLQDNYRSHHQILDVASNISGQINERLHHRFSNVEKLLVASNKTLPPAATIAAYRFKSDAGQYAWITEEIKRLVDEENCPPSEIAVLAPKHKYLAPLLPFFARAKLPVRYEKRENILDIPLIKMLNQMVRLTLALASSDQALANSLWPEVISYEFWGFETEQIWRVSLNASLGKKSWTESLLDNYQTKPVALLFLKAKDQLNTKTLEELLDSLIGNPLTIKSRGYNSSFYEYYFGKNGRRDSMQFMDLLSCLNLLRARLRQWKRDESRPLNLHDFVNFIDAYQKASVNILNTSPYYEADDALNILTAYSAKGREFKAVFVIDCQDDVWGSASRNQGNRLSLPANLQHIRYQGASEDERLRLFFVAITRAKTHLYLTSYEKTLAGKATTPLKYLSSHENLNSQTEAILEQGPDDTPLSTDIVQDYWTGRHKPPFNPRLRTLLAPRLKQYRLSTTHLNQFTDVINGGPQAFFLEKILRFAHAPQPSASYGDAMHETLRWLGQSYEKNKKIPLASRAAKYFEKRLLAERLNNNDFELYAERGKQALKIWLDQRQGQFHKGDLYELNFRYENIALNNIQLTGKIDRLSVNQKAKTIIITDFKTGRPEGRWDKNSVKLHKYRQQLMVYKLLVENSSRFAGYKVERGFLEFIEPDEDGRIVNLQMDFNDEEITQLTNLLAIIWKHIQNLDFPDTSQYPQTISGIRQFENDLLASSEL